MTIEEIIELATMFGMIVKHRTSEYGFKYVEIFGRYQDCQILANLAYPIDCCVPKIVFNQDAIAEYHRTNDPTIGKQMCLVQYQLKGG